jgi:AcrR family transcriptional regulator
MRSMTRPARDRRARRSRGALLDAFFTLVLKEPYERITVQQIAERAGVARSTLYEHFSGKDELLAASLAGPFSVLADAVREQDNTEALVQVLEHFWANRGVAPGVFAGATRRHAVAVLVRLIEQRLRAVPAARRAALLLPPRRAATALAEALFAPVAAWTLGQSSCSARRLATSLRLGTQALTCALHGGRARVPHAAAADPG